MAKHVLAVTKRISGNPLVVVIGCSVCGWEGAMNPRYERMVLESTAECPGTNDWRVTIKALIQEAATKQKGNVIELWDSCFSWQEVVSGPMPNFREASSFPPSKPPDWPPKKETVIGPIVAIQLDHMGAWTVWTPTEIYFSHHPWQRSATIQPPDNAFHPV